MQSAAASRHIIFSLQSSSIADAGHAPSRHALPGTAFREASLTRAELAMLAKSLGEADAPSQESLWGPPVPYESSGVTSDANPGQNRSPGSPMQLSRAITALLSGSVPHVDVNATANVPLPGHARGGGASETGPAPQERDAGAEILDDRRRPEADGAWAWSDALKMAMARAVAESRCPSSPEVRALLPMLSGSPSGFACGAEVIAGVLAFVGDSLYGHGEVRGPTVVHGWKAMIATGDKTNHLARCFRRHCFPMRQSASRWPGLTGGLGDSRRATGRGGSAQRSPALSWGSWPALPRKASPGFPRLWQSMRLCRAPSTASSTGGGRSLPDRIAARERRGGGKRERKGTERGREKRRGEERGGERVEEWGATEETLGKARGDKRRQ